MTHIDLTPTPAGLRSMLEVIIENSTVPDDVRWARDEMLRCFPALTVAHDTHNGFLVVGSKEELSAYCAQIAKRHGAGHCDIYSFAQPDMTVDGARDFIGAFDTETITLGETK